MEITPEQKKAVQKYFDVVGFEVLAPGEKGNDKKKPIVLIRIGRKREFCYLDDVLSSYAREQERKKNPPKPPKKVWKEVQVGGRLVTFHENCPTCEEISTRMVRLRAEMDSVQNDRKFHLSSPKAIKPEDQVRYGPHPKVNLHLEPDDVTIPSTWPNQANVIREQLKNRKWI